MKNQGINFSIIISVIATLLMSTTAIAGEEEDQLVAKITAAYGGDALLTLSNYRVEEVFLAPATGQSHSPGLTEIGQVSQVLTVDIRNKKAVYDTWYTGRSGGFQNSTVGDGDNAYAINYQTGTYGEAANADPYSFAGGTMRTSDTILAYELSKAKDQVKLLDDETYMNRLHHRVTMPFPLSSELTLYIDAETFLISKMLRNNPQFGDLDYVFSDYQQNNGITFASTMNFFIAGVPNLIGTRHQLSFNNDLSSNTFAIADNLVKEQERIDTSKMIINKVSDRVYHIGQGNAYSIFVDTSMGIIATGGYAGLQGRFAAFQSASDNFKPLTYQVVTHHHVDHIGGMSEAIAAGARLLTVGENIQAIKDAVRPTPDDRHFLSVNSRATFGDGRNRVEIYEVSTIHAASFLVSYIPAEKMVFIADHMGSPFLDAVPIANQGTVDMLAALEGLGIDIKKIATAHNARIFTLQDMRTSVAAFKPSSCAASRPACK